MIDAATKASLAFHYIANGLFDEVERLYETVEMKNYTCADFEFSNKLAVSLLFSTSWGNEYWKHRALLAESACDEERVLLDKRCMAIDLALDTLCGHYGLAPDDVRRLSNQAMRHKPIACEVEPDMSYLAELIESYRRMIESWPGAIEQKGSRGSALH